MRLNFGGTITAAALLFSLSSWAVAEECATIEELGTPSLERFDYSLMMEAEGDNFRLSIAFKHDPTLPLPTDPMTQCDPFIVPPEIASDGLPFFAFRWFYEQVPEEVKAVTGIDHISIDFNSCGHPPTDIFGAPHYDIHVYLVTPEERTCMTCAKFPGSPICDFTPDAQTTESGKGFFEVATVTSTNPIYEDDPFGQPRNMPSGFQVGIADMIPLMGGHAWNFVQQPSSAMEWAEPIWIMGPYANGIVDYEPMIPFAFMTGDVNKEFTETLSYEGQTIAELPTSYTVKFDAATTVTTISLTRSIKGSKKRSKKSSKKSSKKRSRSKHL